MKNRYDKIFHGTIAVSITLILLGLLLDDPRDILPGRYRIVFPQMEHRNVAALAAEFEVA